MIYWNKNTKTYSINTKLNANQYLMNKIIKIVCCHVLVFLLWIQQLTITIDQTIQII
jgi:hypothetical protein